MRFHNERDKRLHPLRSSQILAPQPGNEKFVVRRRETLAQRPVKRFPPSKLLLTDDEIVEDSLMFTVCYEAHKSMQQMLSVLAEMRGDDAEGPVR
jgi:hypothetical protein